MPPANLIPTLSSTASVDIGLKTPPDMAFGIPPAVGLIGCIAVVIYLLYRSLLPKPIPGIPCNDAATKSLLGDLPALIRTGRQDPHNWLAEQCIALNSPVIQAFMRPFRRPWIILTDYQEANDIMTRRTREFDRSDFFGVSTGLLWPRPRSDPSKADICSCRTFSVRCSPSSKPT